LDILLGIKGGKVNLVKSKAKNNIKISTSNGIDIKNGNIPRSNEKEWLLQNISHNINEALFRSDYHKGLIYVNEAFSRMFGYNSTIEVLNTDTDNFYGSRFEKERISQEILIKGSVANREIKFRRKDGTAFIGSMNSTKVTTENGEILIDGAIRDITREKKAEKELTYQSSMQKLLIHISTKYINISNEKTEDTIHNSLEEIGLFLDIDRIQIHDYDFNKMECSIAHEWCRPTIKSYANSTNTPIDAISELVKSHISERHVFIKDASKLKDQKVKSKMLALKIQSALTIPRILEKKCVGFISFHSVKSTRNYSEYEITMMKLFTNMIVNITSRTSYQKKLYSLLETTSLQNQHLKNFSRIASHSIRSSVSNLIAINTLIQEKTIARKCLHFLDVTISKLLDISVTRLNKSVSNINSLLNFDMERKKLEKEPFDISSSIKRVLEEKKKIIKTQKIEVQNKLKNELVINTFSVYLDDVFLHLLNNAIEHGTSKDSNIISIKYSATQDSYSIHITDFGRGMDLSKYRNKLFKAGTKLHSDSKNGEGMGLFISKYMIEAIGGRILVDSEPNKGSTFTVILPRN
jgi:PAS domain S-box-containing protein